MTLYWSGAECCTSEEGYFTTVLGLLRGDLRLHAHARLSTRLDHHLSCSESATSQLTQLPQLPPGYVMYIHIHTDATRH